MARGYFGLVLFDPKYECNYGTLVRTANILNVSLLATVGKQFKQQVSDTLKSSRHIPTLNFKTFQDLKNSIDVDCKIVAVELTKDAFLIEKFTHPEKAIYIVGNESKGIPENILDQCDYRVKLQGSMSMNVAVAGSVVLYDRVSKRGM